MLWCGITVFVQLERRRAEGCLQCADALLSSAPCKTHANQIICVHLTDLHLQVVWITSLFVCACVCAAKSEGRSCEYNGRIYQNGESFRAGCKHQCTCIDGAVGCAPLCNNKLPPASSSCPYPQLVRKPGQCCFSVDCSKGSWPRLPKHQVCFLSIRLSVHLLYMGFVFHKLLFT